MRQQPVTAVAQRSRAPGPEPCVSAVASSTHHADNSFAFDFARTALYSEHEGKREREPAKKIEASGDPDITITYTPEPTDKSTKIVFIQEARTSLDGVVTTPGAAWKGFAYQDKDTTAAGWCVDYFDGEKDPYANGDDKKFDWGTGKPGNALKKPPQPATMEDGPEYPNGKFPKGSTKYTLDFRTAAFSAAGEDQGTFYAFVDWSFEQTKGEKSSITVGSTGTGSPGQPFRNALELWCSHHAFDLPTPNPK